MDEEQAKLASEEAAAMTRMFETDGWRILVRDTTETLERMQKQGWDSIKSLEQLWYAKGFMEASSRFINHQKTVEAFQEELAL